MTRSARGKIAERLGRWAERLCIFRLMLFGWRILEHGFRTSRGTGAGEIDIVATKSGVLIFVEVKARDEVDEGLRAVRPEQQARIARGAEVYLQNHPNLANHDLRFDVMIVRPWRWPYHVTDAWRP